MSDGWIIRLPSSFLKIDMSDRLRCMLLTLEKFAREKPFVWPGNESLAKSLGKSERTVQAVLPELEKLGWIKLVYSDTKKRKRLAIIMRRRIDPDRPAASTDEQLKAIVAILIERGNSRTAGAEICELCMKKPAPELKTELEILQKEQKPALKRITLSDSSEPDDDNGKATRASLAGLLKTIMEPNGKPKAAIQKAARLLAEHFADEHSLKRYLKELWSVAKGGRPSEEILKAFDTTEEALLTEKLRSTLGGFFFGCLTNGYDLDRNLEEERVLQGMTVHSPIESVEPAC